MHLFYLGGYHLVFNQLEKESELKMASRLEKSDYSDHELIEIKLPVNIPYQANSAGFEQFVGEIEVDGMHYNYVKRKMQNDTLILLCLPNNDKSNISTARETFFSLVNEMNRASDGKSIPSVPAKSIKFSVSDFDSIENQFTSLTVKNKISYASQTNPGQLCSGFIEGSVQPPDAVA
ncbi:hypothetical protein [Pollutibacter soli]|uniref:hypothetical protein n=1 Tax=Pollutibacter soli TaxID=3034157 RepID=UPI00301370BF